MNFEQILRSKIKEQSPNPSFAQSSESLDAQGVDPAHLAFLMGQVGRQSSFPRGKYPVRPVARKAHVLNESQALAYVFLKNWTPQLSEAFTRHELKAAFRQAALRLHPDCGGSAEAFMALRDHYKTLDLIFS